jgi:hypothetical protein
VLRYGGVALNGALESADCLGRTSDKTPGLKVEMRLRSA